METRIISVAGEPVEIGEQEAEFSEGRPLQDAPVDLTTRIPTIIDHQTLFTSENSFRDIGTGTQVAGLLIENNSRGYSIQDGVTVDYGRESDVILVADGHGGEQARDIVLEKFTYDLLRMLILAEDEDPTLAASAAQEATQLDILHGRTSATIDGAAYAAVRLIPDQDSDTVHVESVVPSDCEVWIVPPGGEPFAPAEAKDLSDPDVVRKVEKAGGVVRQRYGDAPRVGRLAVANAFGDEDTPGVSARELTSSDIARNQIKRHDLVVLFSDGLRHNLEHDGRDGDISVILEILQHSQDIMYALTGSSQNRIDRRGAHVIYNIRPSSLNRDSVLGRLEKVTLDNYDLVEELISDMVSSDNSVYQDDLALALALCKRYIAKVSYGEYNDDVTLVVARVGERPKLDEAQMERYEGVIDMLVAAIRETKPTPRRNSLFSFMSGLLNRRGK